MHRIANRLAARLARFYNALSFAVVGCVAPLAVLLPCLASGYRLTLWHAAGYLVALAGAWVLVTVRGVRERLLVEEAERRAQRKAIADQVARHLEAIARQLTSPHGSSAPLSEGVAQPSHGD